MKPKLLYQKLFALYGPQNWWPVAEKPLEKATYQKRGNLKEFQQFEVCVGTILTQNTSWRNVEKAIQNLKRAERFSLKTIANAKPKEIAELIRSTGYFNQKTMRLQAFCKYVLETHGCIQKMLKKPVQALRTELLELQGIGRETADSIILYAAQQPAFVVDAYTKRFAERYYKKTMDYEKTQLFFEQQLSKETELFNEYHALLVEHAKQYCKTKPDCANCFLKKTCHFE